MTESADAFSPTRCLLAEPAVESSRPKLSAITRQEVALTQPGPEVPGLKIGDHGALIPHGAQPFSHEVRDAHDHRGNAVLGGVVARQPELAQAISSTTYVFSPIQDRVMTPVMIDGMLLPRRPNAIRPRASCETPVRLPISVKTPKISAPAACPTTMITID